MFNIKISVKEDKILGEITFDSFFFEKSKYHYAFYLFNNGERVDTVWYKKNMDVAFNIEDMTGDFTISAFIRDISYGNVRSYKSDKIIFNNSPSDIT